MKQIRVLLIEDHFLARVALQSVLAGYAQIEVVGEAGEGVGSAYLHHAGSQQSGNSRRPADCREDGSDSRERSARQDGSSRPDPGDDSGIATGADSP